MILKNCTFFNEFFEKEFGDIRIENGKISEIGIFNDDGIDMNEKIILPGFIDIHVHGAAGGDASDCSEKALEKMSFFLAKHGITSFCPTTMTLPVERLCEIAGVISECKNKVSGAKIAGINFEGPFISKGKKGAQNESYITAGTIADFERLFSSSNGLMKLITIAPEAFESDEFIKKCSEKCIVSIGHTEADAAQTERALSNGANHFTHLFNAMTPLTHREAGTVGAAFDSDATCELICDGVHVCPSVLRTAFKALGEDRACVISDSMRAAGLGTGEFDLGGQRVFVDEKLDAARLEDGNLAASITNLFDEFKNLLAFGIDFKTALKACTINPAKAINEEKNIGSIAVGKSADFTVTDEELNLIEVYINGKIA